MVNYLIGAGIALVGFMVGVFMREFMEAIIDWKVERALKKAGKHWSDVLNKVEAKEAAKRTLSFELPKSEDFPIETLTEEEKKEYEKKLAKRVKEGEEYMKTNLHPKPNQWVPKEIENVEK